MPEHSVEWLLYKAVVLDNTPQFSQLITSHGLPSSCCELFLHAVKLSRTEIVQFLLEKDVQINIVESLRYAVANRELELVQILLSSSVTVDASEGYALLRDATKLGHAGIAVCLLEKGVPVNREGPKKDTPLHFAVANKDTALILRLLEREAAIDALNAENETPLHVAIAKDDTTSVCLLLSKGPRSLANNKGHKPFEVACIKRSVSMVNLLLSTILQSEFIDARSLFDGLCIASRDGCEEIVSSLLKAGADSNILGCYAYCDDFPLHLACKGGHLGVVKLLVEYREELIDFAQLKDGCTPLYTACENGHMAVVTYLIAKHADPNIASKDGSTPLQLFAEKGNLNMVDLLCRNGARVDTDSKALLLATKKKHAEVAKILLLRGASVNVKDRDRCTPLYYALKNENHSLCRFIIQFEPVINPKLLRKILYIFNNNGTVNAIVDDLIAYSITADQSNADRFCIVTATNKGYKKTVETLMEHRENPKDSTLDTSYLHLAVQNEQYELIKTLLEAKHDVNAENAKGNTPLYCFFDNCQSIRRFDIFHLLIDNGAVLARVPDALYKAVENDGFEVCEYLINKRIFDVATLHEFRATPLLHYVVSTKRNNMERHTSTRGQIARLLLNNGAQISSTDEEGETALHLTAKNGRTEVLLILLEFKADVNVKNRHGFTPLHLAIKEWDEDVNEILLNAGADVDGRHEEDGVTYIFRRKGYVNIVALLLKSFANIDAQDPQGRTPLHWAVSSSNNAAIAILFEHSCDVNISDGSGEIALGTIDMYTKREVVDTVIKHLLRLKSASIFLNEQNERLMREILSYCEINSYYNSVKEGYKEFEENCKKEIKRMEQLKLCCHLSLLDALVYPSNPAFLADEKVMSVLGSVKFEEFPIYRALIRNKHKKNKHFNHLYRAGTSAGITVNE